MTLLALAAVNTAFLADHFMARYVALEVVALCVALAPLVEMRNSAGTRLTWITYLLLRVGDVGLLAAILILQDASGTLNIGPVILSGSWSISRIAAQQSQAVGVVLVQPVGLLRAFVGLIGKLKRSPFDIPKAKSEIGAGPLTECSGRKLALWYLSLHIKTVVGIFLLVEVFLATALPG